MERVKEEGFDLQDVMVCSIFRNTITLFKRSALSNISFICSGPSRFVHGTIIVTRSHQESATVFQILLQGVSERKCYWVDVRKIIGMRPINSSNPSQK
jgi:hypothetical protein